MKKNIGNLDRIVRIIIGIVGAVLYFGGFLTGTPGLVLFLVGAVLFATALVRTCPIYLATGLSSLTSKS